MARQNPLRRHLPKFKLLAQNQKPHNAGRLAGLKFDTPAFLP